MRRKKLVEYLAGYASKTVSVIYNEGSATESSLSYKPRPYDWATETDSWLQQDS